METLSLVYLSCFANVKPNYQWPKITDKTGSLRPSDSIFQLHQNQYRSRYHGDESRKYGQHPFKAP